MKLKPVFIIALLLVLYACGSSKSAEPKDASLRETMEDKNRMSVSLLNQIRRLPGVALRNGVPVFTKTTNSIAAGNNFEPLYVLNDYIVGNSFRDINQLVENVNVAKIEAITDSEASFYGSRGANGVIKITTIK